MSDEELKQLIASNAKSIEALTNSIAAERQEREKDRNQLYQYLARIASAQASFYEVQADYYNQLQNYQNQLTELSARQTKVDEKLAQMQEALVEILKRLSN